MTYDEQINAAYGSFLFLMKREPSSVDELVRPGLLQRLPPTPPGKQWQIDRTKKRVVLK